MSFLLFLSSFFSGTDKLDVLEAKILPALSEQHADVARARELLAQLQRQIGASSSCRARLLEGAVAEVSGQQAEALSIYGSLFAGPLRDVAKRKAALVEMGQGHYREAVQILVRLNHETVGDSASWALLCECYLLSGEYEKAAFAAEERLLFDPYHPGSWTVLAETVVVTPDVSVEGLRFARKCLCEALIVSSRESRSIRDLLIVLSAIESSERATSEDAALADKLRARYSTGTSIAEGMASAQPDPHLSRLWGVLDSLLASRGLVR